MVDRIQSGGAASINQAQEKIYELGNFNSVATIRDIPDLTFDVESFDMTCEFEALLTGAIFAASSGTGTTAGSLPMGTAFDFANALPIDVISPFKSNTGAYDIVDSVAIPYLTLERATYRFGVRQSSTQQFSLRGDSIMYIPGQAMYKEYAYTGAATYAFGQTAIIYTEAGVALYALCVTALKRSTHVAKRLFIGDDYTNTTTGFTVTAAGALAAPTATYDKIAVVYGTASITALYPQSVHAGITGVALTTSPAAVRGKDIDVYIGTNAATPVYTRWTSVQSIEVTRSVNLEADEELGNPHYVTQDYVTADVAGTLNLKPRDVAELFTKIATIADVATNVIAGPFTSATLPLQIQISDPDLGTVLKTLYIPDARFTMPGIQGRANSKLETSIPFTSDSGQLLIYKGLKP